MHIVTKKSYQTFSNSTTFMYHRSPGSLSVKSDFFFQRFSSSLNKYLRFESWYCYHHYNCKPRIIISLHKVHFCPPPAWCNFVTNQIKGTVFSRRFMSGMTPWTEWSISHNNGRQHYRGVHYLFTFEELKTQQPFKLIKSFTPRISIPDCICQARCYSEGATY